MTARGDFDQALTAERAAVYAYAMRLTKGREADAEDLTSDTMLRALERWEDFRPESCLFAWLRMITFRLYLNRYRGLVDRRTDVFADLSFDDRAFDAAGTEDVESVLLGWIEADEIERAIAALPAVWRDAVLLSDICELKYAEIAAVLGAPEGTVKSRIFRGRRELQRQLQAYRRWAA